ncbi:polycystic kidney disease 2-like 1 protein isoform X2 [Zootermopsis nevadensis]|uniref:Polycystic kidney disease 2-like 1 protein n=1 Tax=Zootermopsis nevadensis TaxID=136037 RepID=A0A067QUD1_ZOONE|nr:polycystic kidney disease 2-like 1 protein isoform X2 [Zootermopsis nevadensis]KDR07763.1 Polycystic kidney disease 2-like 1 protein [Zootermopsis nevadensis]
MIASTTNYNVKEQEPAAEDIQFRGMKQYLLAILSPNKNGTILDDIKFILYLIFLFVLIIVTLGNPPMWYWCKNHLNDSFMDARFHDCVAERTFKNLSTITQFWKFAETVMIDSIYGKSENDTHQAFVLQDSKLVGVPRLRQVRVRNDSCVVRQSLNRSIELCYEPYSHAYEDTKPFWPGNGTAWTYSTAEELGGSSYRGRFSKYGGGGYYEDLSLNRSEAIEKLLTLKNNQWITGRTRAIFLDLMVYNANNDAIFIVKLVFENIPRRGIYTHYFRRTVRLHQLVTAYHYFVAVCECMFVAFIFYYTIILIVVLKWEHVDSVFDVVGLPILLGYGYGVICFRIYGYVVIEPQILQNISEEKLGNFESFCFFQNLYNILESVFLMNVVWPQLCKYTSFKHASSLFKHWKEITAVSVVIIFIFVICLHVMNCRYCNYQF